ncbi:MAG: signal peptidase II [Syntrophales bacterium]
MKKSYLIFFITAIAVLILDQLTKFYVDSYMFIHESIPVISGLFSITYVRNPGAAFGFLASMGPLFRSVFFITVSAGAIVLIFYYIRKSQAGEDILTFSLSLIMGGAGGNLIDRVRFGEVIDFLDVYIGSHHWPAFNIADSAISAGAILLILEMIRRRKERGR